MQTPQTEKAAGLKEIIRDLHEGLPPEEAKKRFDALTRGVSPREIAAMEEELIREGMPPGEIQNLCDLHVSVMRKVLDGVEELRTPPGHPVHTAMAENRVITKLANRLAELANRWEETFTDSPGSPASPASAGDDGAGLRRRMREVLEELAGVDSHYVRKEHQLFPYLERHGITGPPKVMWGVHDEIRGELKAARKALETGGNGAGATDVAGKAKTLARSLVEMVYKENKILFPLAVQTLSREEWAEVKTGDDELGYAFAEPEADFPGPGVSLPIARTPSAPGPDLSAEGRAGHTPGPDVAPAGGAEQARASDAATEGPATSADAPDLPSDGLLSLGTGRLTLEQVDQIFRHLPVDLSFVDASGHVRYYSETPERVFPRSPAAIGRHVENCHPPKSVHMVKEILRTFEAGEQDDAEFWIQMKDRFIHIRYFAVRNAEGTFLGTLEVSQDATHLRELEGERRLLEWD